MVLTESSAPAAASQFPVGTHVLNFNCLCKVLEVRPNGDLIVMHVGLGGSFQKWIADPSKCTAAPLEVVR